MRLTKLGKAVLVGIAILFIVTIVISMTSINDTNRFLDSTDSFIEVIEND